MRRKVLLFFSGKKTVQKNVPIPLSILAVAAPLLESGYSVDIVDSRVDDFTRIDLSSYLVVGISSVSGGNMAPAIDFAQKVRNDAPGVLIVWGGIHASALPEQSLQSDLVDAVVIREGEGPFTALVQKVFEGDKDYRAIKGLSYKEDGRIIHNAWDGFADIERLPFTPYHLLNPTTYGYSNQMTYISSRGCPHNCTFCYSKRHNGATWRPLNAERVLDDLVRICRAYHPKGISFADDNFFVSRDRVARICEGMIRKGLNITWGASCRSDYLARFDKEFIALLVRSGLRTITLGFESGSERMLARWCGNKRVADHYNSMKNIAPFPVECCASFMTGYPGETRTDIRATFKMIKDLKKINPHFCASWVNTIFPFPDTDLYYAFQPMGFKPPNSLEGWSRMQLHCIEALPWHSSKRLARLENLHKLSVWCMLGERPGWQTIRRSLNSRASRIRLLASISSFWRFNTGFFDLPWDINFLHFQFKSTSDFDMPD